MIRLIRADLRRIFKKRSFNIMLILALLILFMRPRQETAADQIESIKNYMNSVGMMFVCVTAFLGVYADEIRTGSMIGVIGRGMHRRKVLLAKLIEAGIILLLFYGAAYLLAFLDNESAALGVTRRQELFLLIYCLYTVIRGIGLLALASLISFVTWNASGGMTILVMCLLVWNLFLKIVQDKLMLPVYDLSFDGLLESSFTSFSAGYFGWQILPAVLIYVVGVAALSAFLFQRKELDL